MRFCLTNYVKREKRFGRVPIEVTSRALNAFAMVNFDESLAELLRDSADENHLAGVRSGTSDVRILEYAVGTGRLHIGLSSTTIAGTLVGRPESAVAFVSANTRFVLNVDTFGEFFTSGFGTGPLRFEVGSGASRVVTDWVLPPRL